MFVADDKYDAYCRAGKYLVGREDLIPVSDKGLISMRTTFNYDNMEVSLCYDGNEDWAFLEGYPSDDAQLDKFRNLMADIALNVLQKGYSDENKQK